MTRYEYPALDLGALVLLGNTAEGALYEFRTEVFADRAMSPFLLENRLIHFAKSGDWQYDPVCLDARQSAHRREFPVIRVDGEEILCNNRLRIMDEIAPSFFEFVRSYVARD